MVPARVGSAGRARFDCVWGCDLGVNEIEGRWEGAGGGGGKRARTKRLPKEVKEGRLFRSTILTNKNYSPRTTISNSVDAGLASHEKPMTLNMLASMSPSMAGGDEWAGKYAKNLKRAQRDRHRSARTVVTSEPFTRAGLHRGARFIGQNAEEGIRNMGVRSTRHSTKNPTCPCQWLRLPDGVVDGHPRSSQPMDAP